MFIIEYVETDRTDAHFAQITCDQDEWDGAKALVSAVHDQYDASEVYFVGVSKEALVGLVEALGEQDETPAILDRDNLWVFLVSVKNSEYVDAPEVRIGLRIAIVDQIERFSVQKIFAGKLPPNLPSPPANDVLDLG